MTETNTVEPIKKAEAVHVSGMVRSVFLALCDGITPENKGKARVYHRAFTWAASGEWSDYDDWYDVDESRLITPPHLLKGTAILDADKQQQKAITTLISDALEKAILPGNTLRKLDKIYRQIEGESLVED